MRDLIVVALAGYNTNDNDKWLSFCNYNRKKRLPFVVYADLECILEKTGIDDERIPRFTYQHHKIFSIGYYVCCQFDESMSMYSYCRGANCVECFVDELYRLMHRVKSLFLRNTAMNQFTTQQWKQFLDATRCHICEKPFQMEHKRVRDHCHVTGRYRGAAHEHCNVNYQESCVIPVLFHNLSGHDAYFIIKGIANRYEGNVSLLPVTVTKENYISFTKYVKDTTSGSWRGTNTMQLRFVDSYKFLSSSLEKLVSYIAMMEPLPYGEFQWMDNIDSFEVMSVPIESDIGYILEIDLEYPYMLHDFHVDLPFCPTREIPPGGKRYEKLLATLHTKERYVIHYRNLQQCIRHGLVVTKIHRIVVPLGILKFAQSRWLRGYIVLNTRFRMLSNNDFERNLYKLMNNAVFGKTMENVRDYKDVRLITYWDGRYGLKVMLAKPNFCSRSIFSEDLVVVELRKLEVMLNKPIYVGMCILEISKIRLYEFHYEYMLPLYRDNYTIMYTDTDSLMYLLTCDNVYEDQV
ncbi:hypothetical protein ALC62_05813 [Cyphomyrmex costatus]|uniref:DNA-directed DNA polymerase n=1 Tax=Cyphomyrmex costatus TaxID=456900 RepID=A0A151IJF4_9HYME|nr:hypothetical protein ALC62_05813 [Cyphomyrmex costatus]